MKCYAKSSVNLIARLANLHPKTTFFIKVFSFVFLVPEKRIIFAKVQRRIKSKIRLSYRLSFKLLVVNQSNMLHRKVKVSVISWISKCAVQKLVKNADFWWEKVQKWLWNKGGDIMIILRNILSSTNRHKSGPGTSFHRPYYPICHSW